MSYKKAEGSITVFLSLILLLILSLIFTIIEGARVRTANIFAERALSTAMDSVLAEYYRPLWDEYHVFGYYQGEGTKEESEAQMEKLINKYMTYTFRPNTNLNGFFDENGIELYDISTDKLFISNKTNLTDQNGELLINEAVEYMKYQELGNGIEELLNKLSLLETPTEVSYVMEEKLKVDEELVEIDTGVLELMELLDGVKTSDKGIEIDANGSLITAPYFIKKLCYKDITMENVGINNEKIFQILKNNYIDPAGYFNDISLDLSRLKGLLNQIDDLESAKEVEASQLEREQDKFNNLASIEKKTKSDDSQIKEVKGNINARAEAINELDIQIRDQRKQVQTVLSEIEITKTNLMKLTKELIPFVDKAIITIEKILYKIEVAKPMILQYEELLKNKKKFINKDVYSGLAEGFMEVKRYIDTDVGGYDFKEMKDILEQDKRVLSMAQIYLLQAEEKLSSEQYEQAGSSFEAARGCLFTYQINELNLDYSTLVLDKSGKKSPLDNICSLLQGSLTGLVLEDNKISDAKLSSTEVLPSETACRSASGADYLDELIVFFNNARTSDNNNGMENIFTGFRNGTLIFAAMEEGTNAITEHFLYQEYLKEHFGAYQSDSNLKQSPKPSALKYEQEYIMTGKESDKENLEAIISRIIFIRTVTDFASVLTNKSIQAEAKLVATSLVGFTGLPVLISVTQILILLLWAFAEALLDTCALMMGKEVPLLKKNIVMQFPDLFLLNRENLQKKALLITKNNEPSFSYQDYLRLFFLMEDKTDLAYHSMDLIQENIKLRYQEDYFKMQHCLYGFEAKADFIMKSKFTAISYVKKVLDNREGNFLYTTILTYSY